MSSALFGPVCSTAPSRRDSAEVSNRIYPRRSRARRGSGGLVVHAYLSRAVVSSRRPARHDEVSWARAGGGGEVAIRSPDPAVRLALSLEKAGQPQATLLAALPCSVPQATLRSTAVPEPDDRQRAHAARALVEASRRQRRQASAASDLAGAALPWCRKRPCEAPRCVRAGQAPPALSRLPRGARSARAP